LQIWIGFGANNFWLRFLSWMSAWSSCNSCNCVYVLCLSFSDEERQLTAFVQALSCLSNMCVAMDASVARVLCEQQSGVLPALWSALMTLLQSASTEVCGSPFKTI
jgi:hypothetical protein